MNINGIITQLAGLSTSGMILVANRCLTAEARITGSTAARWSAISNGGDCCLGQLQLSIVTHVIVQGCHNCNFANDTNPSHGHPILIPAQNKETKSTGRVASGCESFVIVSEPQYTSALAALNWRRQLPS
jgi:hypothetical protein